MSSLIFLFILSFLNTSFTACAQNPNFLGGFCPNTTTFSRNSTYSINLTTLLSSLSSRNASYSTGFQNATAGESPDMITGLFLCRGDLSPEACRNCVVFSVNDTLTRCPNVRQAVLYYDHCMLRYSHRNILSTPTLNQKIFMTNGNNMSYKQVGRFEDTVSLKLNQAAVEAANSPRKFFTFKSNWTAFQNLYGLVQCTPDLTTQDCLRCLQISINGLPFYRIGARILYPSCNSRYEIYSFYNETAITTPPLPQLSPPLVPSPLRPGKGGNPSVLVVAIVVLVILVVLLPIACYCFLAKRAKKTYDTAPAFHGDDITTADSLQLDYRTIQTATNDFAERNKIGQGGFGEVYKGILSNGTEVAVKRLSKTSGQGETEFKNEVVVVAKLQHRNLVRLQGFCLEGEERILVYEYVRNKSLDYIIFDPAKKSQLDWTLRFKIIDGIARGILYLHQDSRLTVIHRDLKASNILLDEDMNPKIADFGMARIFGMDQTQEKTGRVVGTLGYMPPEYVMGGHFSMKSDVYSFGVLVLEIISGRRNSSFHERDVARDLVTYAWRLWSNGTALDLVDPIIEGNCQKNEVIRCIHIGLLCVQEDPVKRPTLSTIFVMLTSNTVTLPVPQQPGFSVQTRNQLHQWSTSVDRSLITDIYPR
ncbi:PREDICTED: cysteine-rich receptor-like protein kinase 15 [Camelina sativa]|uniref:Cysteine-rich receptor-like protein kinase 15 n=1 Tax=Camelina sativa TaxID=90675 RepID=A0ABM0TS61_CAMSA|nr:PREDICTED: cysteine-rich receptor-like protein kinase 15 [Camelina sativa]